MNSPTLPECYRVLRAHWTTTSHKTPHGEVLWNVKFFPTDISVTGADCVEALAMARRLGIPNPILEREQ